MIELSLKEHYENKNCILVFVNINWSSDNVFDQTNEFLDKCKHKLSVLQQWWDVDTIEDLELLNQN